MYVPAFFFAAVSSKLSVNSCNLRPTCFMEGKLMCLSVKQSGSVQLYSWGVGRSENPVGALCVRMDFTRTFETTTKCNNINHVWIHFCKFLVVLKYYRRLSANIFDTDICWSINILKKAQYTTLMYRTRAIIGRSQFEAALIYKPRILGLKSEELPFLVHKLSGI